MADFRNMYDRDTVAGRISQPTFDELRGRARRRVRRHRVVGAAAIAALVAVPLLTIQGGNDTQPPPPVQSPSPSLSTPQSFPPALQAPFEYAVNLVPFDISNLYAVYQAEAHHRCVSWLSASHDGGRTWSELRELPGSYHLPGDEDDGGCWTPRLSPLSARMLRLSSPDGAPVTISFLSQDAGATWREHRSQPDAAATMPPGVAPEARCDDSRGECRQTHLRWYDPQTGNERVLAGDPLEVAGTEATVATDGSIWLSGTATDGAGDWVVLVSRDGGRSWQTTRFGEAPTGDGNVAGAAFATRDGTTAYFAVHEDRGGQGWLHRTVDGGESWQRLPYWPPASVLTALWVAPDDALLAWADNGDIGVSRDGGATFHLTTAVPVWFVRSVAGGFYGLPVDFADPADAYLSQDGWTWRPVSAPGAG